MNIDAAVKGAFREAFQAHYGVADPIVDTRVPLADARRRSVLAVEGRLDLFGAAGRAG